MNCPNCGVMNDANNQFCQNCGTSLIQSSEKVVIDRTKSARNNVLSHSFRFLICIFFLWIVKATLTSLGFVKELHIPNFPLSIMTIISIAILLMLLALLIGYSRVVALYWPQAFPNYQEAGSFWTAVIYLIILGLVYKILKPLLQIIRFDTGSISTQSASNFEQILILQLLLLVISVVVIFRAGTIIYYAIPRWYQKFREEWVVLQNK